MAITRLDCDTIKKQSAVPTDESVFAGQQAGSRDPKTIVGADREAWVKHRILTAITASLFMTMAQKVRADEDIVLCGLDGIANGAAVEIIRTLGLEPEFVNLRRPPVKDNIPHPMVYI